MTQDTKGTQAWTQTTMMAFSLDKNLLDLLGSTLSLAYCQAVLTRVRLPKPTHPSVRNGLVFGSKIAQVTNKDKINANNILAFTSTCNF